MMPQDPGLSRGGSEAPVAETPFSRSASLTVSQALDSESSHSTRTGRRLSSIPLRKGSG